MSQITKMDNVNISKIRLIDTKLVYSLIQTPYMYTQSIGKSLMVALDSTSKEFFDTIDDKVIDLVKNNSKQSFKGMEYESLIIDVDDANREMYPDGALLVNIIKSNEFSTLVFDSDKKMLTDSQFPVECFTRLIFELDHVWIEQKKFGFKLKLHQIQYSINKNDNIVNNNVNDDDNDDDNDNVNNINNDNNDDNKSVSSEDVDSTEELRYVTDYIISDSE